MPAKGFWTRRRALRLALNGVPLLFAATLLAPQLLFFPYAARAGTWDIRSEQPIPPSIARVVARADALLAASPINQPQPRQIFLTDGGWRWHVLAVRSADSFGLTRPVGEAIIINRSDVTADRVRNGREPGGERSLSGTIAHEATHGLLRARYGIIAAARMPRWQVEGYCDHVAQESSLDDATARALLAAGRDHPALPYWQGRRRVAELLRQTGGDVDAVMQAENQLR